MLLVTVSAVQCFVPIVASVEMHCNWAAKDMEQVDDLLRA